MRRQNWPLLGLALGLGCLVKNEGLVMAMAVMGVAFIPFRRRALLAVIPLGACLLFLATYKLLAGSPNDILSSSGIVDRLLDWRRYALLAALLPVEAVIMVGPPMVVLLVGAWVEGRPVDRAMLCAVAVILAGYVAIYLITPHDILWHVSSSLDRLVAQIGPTLGLAMWHRD